MHIIKGSLSAGPQALEYHAIELGSPSEPIGFDSHQKPIVKQRFEIDDMSRSSVAVGQFRERAAVLLGASQASGDSSGRDKLTPEMEAAIAQYQDEYSEAWAAGQSIEVNSFVSG